MRTTIHRLWATLFLWIAVLGMTGTPAAATDAPVIRLTAKKFEYDRREIVLKKGVPVVLEITSLDRMHGFNLPDFNLRADAVPGVVTRIRFTPDKTGRFVFFCDIFCGDGHEAMGGTVIVKD